MVIAVFLITLILVLPLIISLYFYYDVNVKKVYFAIYIFGFLKVISGYISKRNEGGIYLHLTDKKAFILKLNSLKGLGDGPKLIKVISINSIYLSLDLGVKNANLITIVYSILSFINCYSRVSFYHGKYTNIYTNFNVLNEDFGFKTIKIKLKLSFNLISILILMLKNYLIKEIKNAKRKKIKFKRQLVKHA